MQEKLKIAVFIDYDNIEIGVKTTLRGDFSVAQVLDTLKERGDIVAKFAYADWGRQEGAKRQMSENAVQMVQRVINPRGDKNGADINLALDALELAFTHDHINAFAIVSGDSDFIPLVNKLKVYGKTVFVIGGKAFTSTILQKNCHEFISFEALLDSVEPRDRGHQPPPQGHPPAQEQQPSEHQQQPPQPQQHHHQGRPQRPPRQRPAPLDLGQAMPLLERALQALERRGAKPQLGLLKSTMLQLDPAFSEKAYGANSFTDFVEKLKAAGYVNVSGAEGRYFIERKEAIPEKPALRPEEALPILRDVLESHRIELDGGALADDLANWVHEEHPELDWKKYGFQEFTELLNFAQDKLLVRIVPDEQKGLLAFLGAEFYPPALPEGPPEELPPPTADDQIEVLAAAEAKKAAAKKARKPRAKPAGVKRTRTAGTTRRRKTPPVMD